MLTIEGERYTRKLSIRKQDSFFYMMMLGSHYKVRVNSFYC